MHAAVAHDRAVEGWLRGEVAAAYDALQADPARAVSVDRVKARLAAVHKKATVKA
jgi:antitoxin ParD1/3/4